jgi:hypothetical protein
MAENDKHAPAAVGLTFLTVGAGFFSVVAFFSLNATTPRLAVAAFFALVVLARLAVLVTGAPSAIVLIGFAQLPLLAVTIAVVSFTDLNQILVPPLCAAAVVPLLLTFLRRPWWLAPLLALPALAAALWLTDGLQPEPPPFAGRYEMRVPGATGLRWDLDLHTNLFGNFTDAPSLRIDEQTYAIPKPPGVFRLVCLGTSQAIGPGLPREDTWCARLGRRLAAKLPDRRVEAVNASVFGADDLMQWIYYDQVVRELAPDVMLVAWFGRIVPPHGSRLAYPHIKSILDNCRRCSLETKRLSIRVGTANPLLRPVLAAFFDARLVRNLRAMTGAGEPENPDFIPKDLPDEATQPDPRQSVVTRYFLGDAGRDGYPLFFVPEVDHTMNHSAPNYFAQLFRTAPPRVIDVRPAFSGRTKEEIFTDWNHFTPLGHELQAEFLAEELARRLKLGD